MCFISENIQKHKYSLAGTKTASKKKLESSCRCTHLHIVFVNLFCITVRLWCNEVVLQVKQSLAREGSISRLCGIGYSMVHHNTDRSENQIDVLQCNVYTVCIITLQNTKCAQHSSHFGSEFVPVSKENPIKPSLTLAGIWSISGHGYIFTTWIMHTNFTTETSQEG